MGKLSREMSPQEFTAHPDLSAEVVVEIDLMVITPLRLHLLKARSAISGGKISHTL